MEPMMMMSLSPQPHAMSSSLIQPVKQRCTYPCPRISLHPARTEQKKARKTQKQKTVSACRHPAANHRELIVT